MKRNRGTEKGVWEEKEAYDKEILEYKRTLPDKNKLIIDWENARQSERDWISKKKKKLPNIPVDEIYGITSSRIASQLTAEERIRDTEGLLGPAVLRRIEREREQQKDIVSETKEDFEDLEGEESFTGDGPIDMAAILAQRMDNKMVPRIGNSIDRNWKIGDKIPYDEKVSAQPFVYGNAWSRHEKRMAEKQLATKLENAKLSPLSVYMPKQPTIKIESNTKTNVLYNIDKKHQLEAVITAIDYLLLVRKTEFIDSSKIETKQFESSILLRTKDIVYDRLESEDFSRPFNHSFSDQSEYNPWYVQLYSFLRNLVNILKFWDHSKTKIKDFELHKEDEDTDQAESFNLTRTLTSSFGKLERVCTRTSDFFQKTEFRRTFQNLMKRFHSVKIPISITGTASVKIHSKVPSVVLRHIEVRPSTADTQFTESTDTASLGQTDDHIDRYDDTWLSSQSTSNLDGTAPSTIISSSRKGKSARNKWHEKYSPPSKPAVDTLAYDKDWRLKRPQTTGAIFRQKASAFITERRQATERSLRKMESTASAADDMLSAKTALKAALKTVEVVENATGKVGTAYDKTHKIRLKATNTAASGAIQAVNLKKKADKVVNKQNRALFVRDLILGAQDADVVLVLSALNQPEDVGPGPIDVNQVDENGTIAIMASFKKLLEIDQLLENAKRKLAQKASGVKTTEKEIRRFKRSVKKYEKMIQILVDEGANLNFSELTDLKTGDGGMANEWTLLHYASKAGNLPRIVWLVQEMEVGLDPIDQHGITPLMLLAKGGHTVALLYLIGVGADIEKADMRGWRPLHHAAHMAGSLTVKTLLLAKAEKISQDFQGNRPSDIALAGNRKVIYQMLQVYQEHPQAGQVFLDYLSQKADEYE